MACFVYCWRLKRLKRKGLDVLFPENGAGDTVTSMPGATSQYLNQFLGGHRHQVRGRA